MQTSSPLPGTPVGVQSLAVSHEPLPPFHVFVQPAPLAPPVSRTATNATNAIVATIVAIIPLTRVGRTAEAYANASARGVLRAPKRERLAGDARGSPRASDVRAPRAGPGFSG